MLIIKDQGNNYLFFCKKIYFYVDASKVKFRGQLRYLVNYSKCLHLKWADITREYIALFWVHSRAQSKYKILFDGQHR